MKTTPPIPELPEGELFHAVSALANSAESFRKAFLLVAAGSDAKRILLDHESTLLLSDEVIRAWVDKLGLEESTI